MTLMAALAMATQHDLPWLGAGCTASVGIGPNRLLARLATRHAKPDGQHVIGREEAAGLLAEEKVGSLPGMGGRGREGGGGEGGGGVMDAGSISRVA